MPKYDHQCSRCGAMYELAVMLADLDNAQISPCCGATMDRHFPQEAVFGIQMQDAYYDPSLGVDIHGRKEKREILKAMGLRETGDKVKGARDFDKHAPHHIKPEPPRGITLSDMQRTADLSKKQKQEQKLYGDKGTKSYRQRRRMDKSKMVHVNTRVV